MTNAVRTSREQIRRRYQECQVGYDTSITVLMRDHGMSAAQADRFLFQER